MNYLRQHKKDNLKVKKITLVVIFFFLLLIVLNYLNPSLLPRMGYSIAAPFWREILDARENFDSKRDLLKEKTELINEKKELEEKLNSFRSVDIEKKALETENRQLRQALNMQPREDTQLVSVLAKPPGVPYDVLIIDGGEDAGFSQGDKVYFGEAVLIGEIDKVYKSTARVILYSSAGVEIDVYINEREEIFTAHGQGGGSFLLEIDRNEEIEVGDHLFKEGKRVSFLGEVVDIEVPETGALKMVYARVSFDLFSLRNVFVLNSEELSYE
ncbi:MAG: rod shape-determining protein MreC [Candidatus Paceibacterota bacterium]